MLIAGVLNEDLHHAQTAKVAVVTGYGDHEKPSGETLTAGVRGLKPGYYLPKGAAVVLGTVSNRLTVITCEESERKVRDGETS